MHYLTRVPFRIAATLGAIAISVSSFAIVSTTSMSDPGAADLTYSFVGRLTTGASAVAVGPNLVLTARHNGSHNFVLDGTTYTVLSSSNAPQYVIGPGDTTNVDLTLIRIDGTLPGWYNLGLTGTLAANDAITMVGFGRSGTVLADGSGYNTTVAPGTRRAGGNTIDGFTAIDVNNNGGLGVTGGGPVMFSFLDGAGEAALASSDSGGGWFENGRLVGISSFVFNNTFWSYTDGTGTHTGNGAPNYGFPRGTDISYDTDGNGTLDTTLPAGTPYFGSAAIDLTDPQIQTWLVSQGVTAVPEPGTFVALGLGAAALLRRRRKA